MSLLSLFRKKEYTDDELLKRFLQTNNQEELGLLFDRHLSLIYGICLKYLKNPDDASDAVMDIYEKLLKDVGRFEIQNFRAWLARNAVNHCLMKLRTDKGRKSRWQEVEFFLSDDVESEHEAHLNKKTEDARIESMHLALQELKDDQRNCITLFYLHRHTYSEIASIMEITENEVKSHIQNGKRNLKNIINDKMREWD